MFLFPEDCPCCPLSPSQKPFWGSKSTPRYPSVTSVKRFAGQCRPSTVRPVQFYTSRIYYTYYGFRVRNRRKLYYANEGESFFFSRSDFVDFSGDFPRRAVGENGLIFKIPPVPENGSKSIADDLYKIKFNL